ncbi:TPA: hypothetical protein ACKRXD_001612 [Proteus mirabilis]|uniref:hypothetical protein n=1 Tax=Proteus mirabilis TaxID=584 RepID=UPI0018C6C803|nr:hypothetical protein [Proteus mirabilis]ELA7720768.1 hypothetical protein [Proteus mirabilis]ELB1214408.1 hypothetical protein [Proteus mirabilis]MBG2964706.1 hypothetical protein [Proteus mirabilis]MBG3041538.1 hypothetical protein [Proteus mirabilis]
MYDDIDNLKNKFQEEGFTFQDFSSQTTGNIACNISNSVINQQDNKDSLSGDNEEFLNISKVKKRQKQTANIATSLSYSQDLASEVKEKNRVNKQSKWLLDNQLFEKKTTDKCLVNEKLSLQKIFLFIASAN